MSFSSLPDKRLDEIHSDSNKILSSARKTNKMACAQSEDLDQSDHPPSLFRVFAVRMKKAWVLSYPVSAHSVGFVMRWLKYIIRSYLYTRFWRMMHWFVFKSSTANKAWWCVFVFVLSLEISYAKHKTVLKKYVFLSIRSRMRTWDIR